MTTDNRSIRENAGYESRCVGALLGTAAGDLLGAPVEGFTRGAIYEYYGEIHDIITPDGKEHPCYTDDTEMTIALAEAIADTGRVNPMECAQYYARHYNPSRRYGASAHTVLAALQHGASYKDTGQMLFREGSYGNGGAMRIAPVGLICRSLSPTELKNTVLDAVICTHSHPEGVDGAVIQARAVSLFSLAPSFRHINPADFLRELYRLSDTHNMKTHINQVNIILKEDISDNTAVKLLGNGVRAVESVPCALLAALRYGAEPEKAVIKAVNMGGDTDTIAAMTGALMGALYGDSWLPETWASALKKCPRGYDYISRLGKRLAKIAL